MTSIVTSILQCTFGVLFNKGRDLMAEKLKDGDVTDQKFRKLILRELYDLNAKIDGLARKDLLASLSFFREGILFLYQVFDQKEAGKVTIETTTAGVGMTDKELAVSTLPSLTNDGSKLSVNTDSLPLVDKNEMLNLNDLSETAKQLLLDAKERFKDARRRAIDAFSNEALKPSDRLLAMKIRILATIMEKIDCPATALESCKLCLEELHKMPVVQNCFSVEITKSFKSWFNKNERWELIANVCQMNYAVDRVTRIVRGDLADQLPFITIGHLQIDPLRNSRLNAALKKYKVEHCILHWTFGSEGEPSHKLCDRPFNITTNTQGQFIVADRENVKVFDPLGKFLYSVPGSETGLLAADKNDNLYLCINHRSYGPEICVFDRNHDLHHRFPLRDRVSSVKSFTISNDDQVFVITRYLNEVDVHENGGRLVHSFGKDVLSQRWPYSQLLPIFISHLLLSFSHLHSITTSGDGVMILDRVTKCVHGFNAQGAHLYKFELNECDKYCRGIVFYEPSQYVLILSGNMNENGSHISIYTKDGRLVRSVQLDTYEIPRYLSGMTITVEGQVAVTNSDKNKVHVLQL